MNDRATVTDPVCGMQIEPVQAVGRSTWNGTTYYFCSRGCETKFDADPEKVLEAAASACCTTTGHSCC